MHRVWECSISMYDITYGTYAYVYSIAFGLLFIVLSIVETMKIITVNDIYVNMWYGEPHGNAIYINADERRINASGSIRCRRSARSGEIYCF